MRRGWASAVLRVACLCIVGISFSSSGGLFTGAEDQAPVNNSPVTSTSPAFAPAQGPHPFLTILCKFADVSQEPEPRAYFERMLGSQYPGLADYWREVSYGKMSLDGSRVTGWLTLPAAKEAYIRAGGKTDLLRLAQDCGRLGGIEGGAVKYFGLNLIFNADLGLPYGGPFCLANAGCYGITWMWPPRIHDQATWAHEMGHALGLGHSGRTAGRVYGDMWDVMSDDGGCGDDPDLGLLPQHMIAYQKDRLGWIPESSKLVVTAAGRTTFTLAPLADLPGPGGSRLLAEIPISGSDRHFYTVEARARTGYDRNLLRDGVVIHEIDLRNQKTATDDPLIILRWQDSSSDDAVRTPFVDPYDGIAVSVDGRAEDTYTVTVRIGATDDFAGNPSVAQGVPAHASAARPERVPDTGTIPAGVAAGQLALVGDQNNVQHALWVDVADGRSDALRYAVRRSGGAWEPAETVESGAAAGTIAAQALAASSDGTVYAAWSQFVGFHWQIRFAARRPGAGQWSRSEEVSSDAGADGWAPTLAVDGSGRVYVLWRSRYDCGSLRTMSDILLGTRNPDGSWQAVQRVDAGPSLIMIKAPHVDVDAAGDVYVHWEEAGPSGSEYYVAVRSAGDLSAGWHVASDAPGAAAPPVS